LKTRSHASFKEKIDDKLPEFSFKIVGHFREEYFHPKHVEIADASTTRLIQKLNAKGHFDNYGDGFSEWNLFFADLVQLVDVNFDGYPDLRFLLNAGATSTNMYSTYIYKPKLKKFALNKDLSMLSGLTIDTDTKTIKTYCRNGWCSEFREYFEINKNDRPILTKVEWTEMDRISAKSGCYKITGIPHKKTYAFWEDTFYSVDESAFLKFMSKRVKVVKKEELEGSLDKRGRGVFGIPNDLFYR
jgi:hypothetical protein